LLPEGVCFGLAVGLGVGAAGSLSAVEFGEGVVVAAFPVTAVAEEELERGKLLLGGFALVDDATEGEGFGGGEAGVFIAGGGGLVGEVVIEEIGFGFVEAAEGPAAVGDVFDGEGFALGLGLEDGADFFVEAGEEGGVFVFEDHVAGDRETVPEGIL
jgi:hypothetical protein